MRNIPVVWAGRGRIAAIVLVALCIGVWCRAEENPLALPEVGSTTLRLLTPTLLELGLVTTKQAPPAHLTQWTFVTADHQLQAPSPSQFEIQVDGQPVTIQA